MKRLAYGFYAASDQYAVAVLVAAKVLRDLSSRDDVDYVVLHHGVSPPMVRTIRAMGMTPIYAPPLPYVQEGFYAACLTKLRVLQLTDYERVVYVDADTLPLKSLDPLFSLSFDGALAAPPAYWLPQPFATTFLFVASPNLGIWDRVARHFPHARERGWFDMDIVNHELANEIGFLPAEYGCLNSEWEDVATPAYFGDRDASRARTPIVHFTACGKPWYYRPGYVRRLRPRAHPTFHELWATWWRERADLLSRLPALSRMHLDYLIRIGQREIFRQWLHRFVAR